MKKFIVVALAAAVATLSFTADANARNPGFQWRNHGWHGHHGYYGHGHYHGHYYGGPYWGWGFGFPGIVIAPGYYDGNADDLPECYTRRVRHHDRNGHVYFRRVEVCD
jgi:uncharacterized membrane protein